MSSTTSKGVSMGSVFCEDNSHSNIPAHAQDFVRAKCPLPKMSVETKGSDGQYHGRAVHRTAVKQHQVDRYHATAKKEWEKLEKENLEAGVLGLKTTQSINTAEDDDSSDEQFEEIDRAEAMGAPTNANAGAKQMGGSKRSWASKIWSKVTGD